MNWYFKCFKQYADFSGRARRKEYWYFTLFSILVLIPLVALDNILGLTFFAEAGADGVLSLVYHVLIFIPSLAVLVRRLHDTGRTGWWSLLLFVPILGWIVLLIFLVQDSEEGTNIYGPNPKLETD